MSGFRISRLQSANSFTCAPVILREALFSGCRCYVDFNTDWCTGTSLYRSPACWMSLYHYKTNSRIISRIIRLELVVRTIGLVVRTIGLIVRTISSPWDTGG